MVIIFIVGYIGHVFVLLVILYLYQLECILIIGYDVLLVILYLYCWLSCICMVGYLVFVSNGMVGCPTDCKMQLTGREMSATSHSSSTLPLQNTVFCYISLYCITLYIYCITFPQ